jgi:protocatechuate 3,4-dioxygenase beta subunit
LHADVTGESIRKNVVDNEPGVKLYLDIQIIDINTCTPIPDGAIEIWGANSSVGVAIASSI